MVHRLVHHKIVAQIIEKVKNMKPFRVRASYIETFNLIMTSTTNTVLQTWGGMFRQTTQIVPVVIAGRKKSDKNTLSGYLVTHCLLQFLPVATR